MTHVELEEIVMRVAPYGGEDDDTIDGGEALKDNDGVGPRTAARGSDAEDWA